MTWEFTPAEKGTAVEVLYAVGGYNPGGFRTLGPAVDGVLHERSIGSAASRRPASPDAALARSEFRHRTDGRE